MHAHRCRTTTSLGSLAVVFFVICAVSTIYRIPAVGELHAQTTWRDTRPSRVPVHAGRRRRRRGVRVRQPAHVPGKFAGVPRGHCAYQRRMDRDNDGRACER